MGSALVLSLAMLLPPAVPARGDAGGDLPLTRIEFLGAASLPTGLPFEGTEVGGLSGLTYDAARGVYYAVSDDSDADPSGRGPVRVYRLAIDLGGGRLAEGAVRIAGVTEIFDQDGTAFPGDTVDPEALVLTPGGTLLFTSEGRVSKGLPPFVREIGLDGTPRRELPVPSYYRPTEDGGAGVRFNQGFESLTLSPTGVTLFTATEDALAQDGPAAAPGVPSPARLLVWSWPEGRLAGEYLYWTEPVAAPAVPPGELETNGLVELLALGETELLALERSFSMGVGFSIRLYRLSLESAENILARERLDDPAAVRPVAKTLLLDLGDLGVPLDNLEGLAWGPPLPDGRRSLVMIADNNFNPLQRTLVLAFAVSGETVTIPEIQGRGHRSPLAGQWVFGVEGLVTAVVDPREGDGDGAHEPERGFFLQTSEEDGEAATSEGIFVLTAGSPEAAAGDHLAVSGRVEEAVGRPGELPVTRLCATPGSGLGRLGSGGPLPPPVRVGTLPSAPRRAPVVGFDDDSLEYFDPATDGLDFWESLEGMRVEIGNAVVVGPSRGDEVVVVPDGGAGSIGRTPRGGVVLAPGNVHPERLAVQPLPGLPKVPDTSRKVPDTSSKMPDTSSEPPVERLSPELPNVPDTSPKMPDTWAVLADLDVGDRFAGPLTGVISYGFSNYRLLLTDPPPPVTRLGPPADPTSLTPAPGRLTVATWNLWNLDPGDGPGRFARIARRIVADLGSPDVVAVEEIQDADGPADTGTTDGAPTFEALVAAVEAAGGPRYVFRQIDPLDNLEGGQPGGNIRVGLLLNPERVEPVDRGRPDPLLAVGVESAEGRPRLSPSPGRVAPSEPAFAGDRERGWGRSRRPLALEARFAGETLFLVAAHFNSKGGEDRLAGQRQPPRFSTQDQRFHQAHLVGGLVEEILAVDPHAAVIVLGDLNEHGFRPPIRRLEAAGLVNLTARVPLEDRYSFNFEGSSGLLDHILVSPRLAAGAEIDIVHTEADTALPRRASDHDAVLARLAVESEGKP
jgi:endonuclease/exonuclease/phosphatase family metal-dependent hydrolase